MTIRGYARSRKLNEATIRQQIEEGVITKEPDGSIDPDQADAARAASLSPHHGGKREPTNRNGGANGRTGIRRIEAQTRRELMKLRIDRLEYDRARGRLHTDKECADAQFKTARALRDEILSIADRTAEQLAALADEAIGEFFAATKPKLKPAQKRQLRQALHRKLTDPKGVHRVIDREARRALERVGSALRDGASAT